MLLERPNVGTNLKLRKVNLPKEMSVELAELVGIQFGDGNLYKNKKYNYILTYCFNSKEKWLHNHTTNIFLKQFGHKLKKRQIKDSAISLSIHSKIICYFFHENFQLPFGKKENLSIPKKFKKDKKLLFGFLRGLYWTDGCKFIKKDRHYRYPIIKITNKSKKFIEQIQEILLKFGFRARINAKNNSGFGFDVVLHGTNQVKMWEEKIMKRSGDTGI